MNAAIAKLCATALLAAALVGVGYWWGDDAATNRAGAHALNAERAKSMQTAIDSAHTASIEHNFGDNKFAISATYQKDQTDVAQLRKETVDRVRTGNQRLWIGTAPTTAGSACSAPAATIGGRDGETRAELSQQASEFLIDLASEADGVTHQLSACQAELVATVKACNAAGEQAGGK